MRVDIGAGGSVAGGDGGACEGVGIFRRKMLYAFDGGGGGACEGVGVKGSDICGSYGRGNSR